MDEDRPPVNDAVKYQRVVLKLSGEALADPETGYGISGPVLQRIAGELKEVHDLGIELAIVVGGGNIFRGMKAAARENFERANADYIGMLATTMNALALQDVLEGHGLYTRVMSAIDVAQIAERYIRRRAVRHLEKGRVVIFAAGTGNPYFTTDTAASLRAMEIDAQVILKGTDVDGVYDKDPAQNPDARRFERLTYLDVLSRHLKVMDATSISLCMDNHLPIIVFDLNEPGNIRRVVCGESVGSLVTDEQ